MDTFAIPPEGPCICGSTKLDIVEASDGSLYVCEECGRYYSPWGRGFDEPVRLWYCHRRVRPEIVAIPGWQIVLHLMAKDEV